ncbi:MAG: metallophosphoesterase [Rhodothermales bacterium]
MQPFSRRTFLSLTGSLVLLRNTSLALPAEPVLQMGVIADLHHGLATDAMTRLERFMYAVDKQKPDCLLQLGDFNFGKPDSDECMQLWRQFQGPKFHVLGNHDMDFYSKAHMMDYWRMPAPYYSFDLEGFHFIILDRNSIKTDDGYIPYEKANFYVDAATRGFAEPAQLEWLKADLEATQLPTVVFVHQGLAMDDLEQDERISADPIEAILAQARDAKGQTKVVACFCGHHHLDRYIKKDGIHYVWLNSASYYWVGDAYGRMAYYEDALFSFLSFYADGSITLEGRSTEWTAPSPAALQFPDAKKLNTFISDRQLF